jgi:hypothetical protein
MDPNRSWIDVVDSITPMAMGAGLLTFILFPFAIPFVLLTIAALLPLILPLVLVGAVAALIWALRLGIRAAGRGVRRLLSPRERGVPRASVGQLR